MVLGSAEVLLLLQRGYVDVGFMGGAQIDQYGNLNSSFIGDPAQPEDRLPGTGGGNDIASLTAMIVAMKHEKRRFVENVDFVTSPGWLRAATIAARQRSPRGRHVPRGDRAGGIRLRRATRRMKALALNPGVTREQVQDNTGFELAFDKDTRVTEPPTERELTVLRAARSANVSTPADPPRAASEQPDMSMACTHIRHRRPQLHRVSRDAGCQALVEYGVRMEELGFDSLWVWDHILLGVEPNFPIIDSLTLLTAIAARTKKIKLGTGILVLPLRNPVVLAKQLSSMDLLSDGRLIMGMASGWYKREFDAVGVPFDKRGKIMDENLDILTRFWTEDMVKGDGDHKIPAGVMYPKPVQKPRPPILIGGYVDRVLQARRRDRRRLADLLLPARELCEGVGEDSRLRGGRRQGSGHAAQRRAAADPDRPVTRRRRSRDDGVARQGVGLRVVERIDQGQRDHRHRRRVRRAAEGASRRRRAEDHFVPYKYEMEQIEIIAREIIPRLRT